MFGSLTRRLEMQRYSVIPGGPDGYTALCPDGYRLAAGSLSSVLAAITAHGEARGRFHQVIRFGGAA